MRGSSYIPIDFRYQLLFILQRMMQQRRHTHILDNYGIKYVQCNFCNDRSMPSPYTPPDIIYPVLVKKPPLPNSEVKVDPNYWDEDGPIEEEEEIVEGLGPAFAVL